VLVASGVAAVSAYEAHVINVKAHVENALSVNTSDVNFGTVFPQEWLVEHRDIDLSDSAILELEDDLVAVNFCFFAEWKECNGEMAYWYDSNTDTWVGPTENYCNWMPFLYVGYNVNDDATQMTAVGNATAGPPSAQPILACGQLRSGGGNNKLYIAIDVPVFEGFYNPLTDPTPKPSGLNYPTYIIPDGSRKYVDMAADPNYDPDGQDFGVDLKIQVTDIIRGP
jgi:hypothetical protein